MKKRLMRRVIFKYNFIRAGKAHNLKKEKIYGTGQGIIER
jgi:hypothetical protein